jgi:hypothetical protein
MDNNFRVNWLNIIFNAEFKNYLNLSVLIEISMLSKITREKLRSIIFKNQKLKVKVIKNDSDDIYLDYDIGFGSLVNEFNNLKHENSHCIEEAFNEFAFDAKQIKKFCKSFYLNRADKAAYYLFRIINIFDNLTDLKLKFCDIPFYEFTNIGITLPKLLSLSLDGVNLVKSPTDAISASDIVFPSNLACLKIYSARIITTELLSDTYQFLFNNERSQYSYENFTLPKVSLPSIKQLCFLPKGEDGGLEEFIEVNPSLESLFSRMRNLNIINGLNSLKILGIDDRANFINIERNSTLDSINTISFSTTNIYILHNIKILCELCPNLAELEIRYDGLITETRVLIEYFLTPALPSLYQLKTLRLINIPNYEDSQILDFTNFTQIEKLELLMFRSLSNIEFYNCQNLNQIEFVSYPDKITNEFKEKFINYKSWKFEFNLYGVKGYKI